MADQQAHSGEIQSELTPADEAEYQSIIEAKPELRKYAYTSKIVVALNDIGVTHETILEQLEAGVSDFWIPMFRDRFIRGLSPGQHSRLNDNQPRLLDSCFTVGSHEQWPGEHFHLEPSAIDQDSSMPKTLRYLGKLGRTLHTEVCKVEYTGDASGSVYALKRARRRQNYPEELEHMKYIRGELSALRKLRKFHHKHFIRLAASYTGTEYVGMLLSPVADCDLGVFLNHYHTHPDDLLLAGFFGCLATSLAYLHYIVKIRHKDIKPENILVKGNNILLTDFGICLDWGKSGITTTHQEIQKTTKYCSPELFNGQPRNSSSDIWSLGCVFLEMAAVLNGKGRDTVYETLRSYSSERFSADPNAITEVISSLREGDARYKEPLDWAEKMLDWDSSRRPKAMDLRDEILRSGGAKYCGTCCSGSLFRGGQAGGGTQNTEPLMATIYVPGGSSFRPIHVEVVRDPSIQKNWISRDVAIKYRLELHENETGIECIILGEKEFKSTERTADITWIVQDEDRTSRDKFLVANAGPTPFQMLLREPVV